MFRYQLVQQVLKHATALKSCVNANMALRSCAADADVLDAVEPPECVKGNKWDIGRSVMTVCVCVISNYEYTHVRFVELVLALLVPVSTVPPSTSTLFIAFDLFSELLC
jgi:hypothetical protein